MGILSKLRGSKDREKSKLRYQSEEVRKQNTASKTAKAKKDVRRAKAAARERAAKLKRRAVEEARAEADRDRSSKRTAGNVEAPETTKEVFRLAGDAAQLRSPVDATLDPSPNGPAMEGFASSVSNSSGRSSSDGGGAGMDPEFVSGGANFADSNGEGDGDEVSENPLEFSDDFLSGGSI
jgi:hypothetical protein